MRPAQTAYGWTLRFRDLSSEEPQAGRHEKGTDINNPSQRDFAGAEGWSSSHSNRNPKTPETARHQDKSVAARAAALVVNEYNRQLVNAMAYSELCNVLRR